MSYILLMSLSPFLDYSACKCHAMNKKINCLRLSLIKKQIIKSAKYLSETISEIDYKWIHLNIWNSQNSMIMDNFLVK